MGRSLKSLKQGRGGNKGKAGVFPARVQAVILNDEDYPDLFKRKDEWASIGSILFSQLQSPSKGKINFENLDILPYHRVVVGSEMTLFDLEKRLAVFGTIGPVKAGKALKQHQMLIVKDQSVKLFRGTKQLSIATGRMILF